MQTENLPKKQLIFNSDDFGMSDSFNEAISKGFNDGLLTSTCVMANGEAFERAMKDVLPQCKGIGLGAHLNIIEGKSLTANVKKNSLLYDSEGNFNNGFGALMVKSTNKDFLSEVEAEFRQQIEAILKHSEIDHLNSHVHTHAIPNIFKLTCKLAQEYKINYIRTQFESPYFVKNTKKYCSVKYPVNLIKVALLNSFTLINKQTTSEFGLLTNDFLIGVGYTGYMDSESIEFGLKALENKPNRTEILIHPCLDKENKPLNYTEFLAAVDADLKNKIDRANWTLTNCKTVCTEAVSA